MNRNERSRMLEDLIDQTSLTTVLEMLSEICYGKAEHLRINWQSPAQAKTWKADAKRVDTLSIKVTN